MSNNDSWDDEHKKAIQCYLSFDTTIEPGDPLIDTDFNLYHEWLEDYSGCGLTNPDTEVINTWTYVKLIVKVKIEDSGEVWQ